MLTIVCQYVYARYIMGMGNNTYKKDEEIWQNIWDNEFGNTKTVSAGIT